MLDGLTADENMCLNSQDGNEKAYLSGFDLDGPV